MPQSFTQNIFNSRYKIALSIIALMAFSSYFFMQLMIHKQKNYAGLINMAGKQRMFSQKIGLNLLSYKNTNEKKYLEQLNIYIENFKLNQQKILAGKWNNDQVNKLTHNALELYKKPYGINDRTQDFLIGVKQEINNKSPYISLNFYATLERLLSSLDEAVSLFEYESNLISEETSLIETCILIVMLFLLFLEAIFIFKPLSSTLKNTIEELIEKRKTAEATTKIKSKFIKNMTDDLKVPLTGVLGAVELMDKENLSQENKDLCTIIEANTDNIINITNEIIDFERISNGNFKLQSKWVNLKELLEGIIKDFTSYSLQNNIELVFNSNINDSKLYYIDEDKLKRLLSILISNSIKFNKPEGKVQIDCDISDNTFTFIVKDNGLGIKEEEIEHIYNSFYQAKNKNRFQSGMGLGLNIAKAIVDIFKGNIFCTSEIDKGSEFSVIFNILSKENINEHSEDENNHKLSNNSKSLNLLVLEDNILNQTILAKYIQKLGHKCQVAHNGHEGIERLEKESFDLVITDIMMPIMNGIEFIEKAKGKDLLRNTKVLGISVNTNNHELSKYIQTGFSGVLQKPFKLNILGKLIDELT